MTNNADNVFTVVHGVRLEELKFRYKQGEITFLLMMVIFKSLDI